MLTVEEIKAIVNNGQPVAIKYVRINNEFRYAVAGGPVEHAHLLRKDEVPTSAGFFLLFEKHFRLHENHSASLQLGPLEEDAELLRAIFT